MHTRPLAHGFQLTAQRAAGHLMRIKDPPEQGGREEQDHRRRAEMYAPMSSMPVGFSIPAIQVVPKKITSRISTIRATGSSVNKTCSRKFE